MACEDCAKTPDGCGCEQEALSINQICNPVVCDAECSETFNAECIIYTGDDITDSNGVVIGTSGDNMAQVMANMAALFGTTNNALLKSYISDVGIGNSATDSEDTLVFAETISKNTLANDGEELNVEVFFEANPIANVDIKLTLGGTTIAYRVDNLVVYSGTIHFNITKIDDNNVYLITRDSYIDEADTAKKGTIGTVKIPFNTTINQPLAINLNNSSAGADQVIIKKVALGIKNL